MQSVTIKYFGMDGTGRNITEAKRDAGSKLERAMDGSYSPVILRHRGTTCMIWREPTGWEYRISRGEDRQYESLSGQTSACDSRDEAIREAIRHLCLTVFDWRTDSDDAPELMTNREDRREYASLAQTHRAFNTRYAKAKAAGLSDTDCHSYALRNPARPELLAIVDGVADLRVA